MKHIYLIILSLLISIATNSLTGQGASTKDVRSHLRVSKVEVKLYPNPATERFSISIPSSDIKYITINNIIGKKIRKMPANPNNSYDVSDLQRGIYIVRIFDAGDNLIKAVRLSKA